MYVHRVSKTRRKIKLGCCVECTAAVLLYTYACSVLGSTAADSSIRVLMLHFCDKKHDTRKTHGCKMVPLLYPAHQQRNRYYTDMVHMESMPTTTPMTNETAARALCTSRGRALRKENSSSCAQGGSTQLFGLTLICTALLEAHTYVLLQTSECCVWMYHTQRSTTID